MNKNYIHVKQSLKNIAAEIEFLKSNRKPAKRIIDLTGKEIEKRINYLRHEYRVGHIAMSMFNGKHYDEIEQKENRTLAKKLKDYYRMQIDSLVDYLYEGEEYEYHIPYKKCNQIEQEFEYVKEDIQNICSVIKDDFKCTAEGIVDVAVGCIDFVKEHPDFVVKKVKEKVNNFLK